MMSKFDRLILLILAVFTLLFGDALGQVTAEDVQFLVISRDDGSAYVMHDQAIPLSHGFHVHRRIEGGEWEQLTETHIMPVQSGPQLELRMGRQFKFLKDRLGREDSQRIFLSLRAQTDENAIVNAAIPELSLLLGRSYIDENAPIGFEVTYRFEIVTDLGRPTGKIIEGTAQLSPETPIAPTNLSLNHEDRRVQLNWNYPTHDQNPDTDNVIRFKTYYRDIENGGVVDASDAVLLRTVGTTEFRKYITVPNRNREYEFWVEAVDFSGQTSPPSETIQVEIFDNVPPPIIRNVRARVNDEYESEITWPVSTELDLAGYHIYKARGDEEEYVRITDELLSPLQTNYLDTETEPGVQYRYSVTALDANGNESQRSNPAHVYIWDYRAPEPVSDLTASFIEETMSVSLNWYSSGQNPPLRTFQLLRRQLYPEAVSTYDQLNQSAYLETEYNDVGYENDGFREGATFEYGIVEVSQNGNRSDTVWTEIQIPVLTPPEPPTSVQTRMRSSDRIQVGWNASVSLDVTSYRVYRNDLTADSTHLMVERQRGQRNWTDDQVELNMDYQYHVTAVDSAGNESEPALSEQITAHRLNPPVSSRNVQAVYMDEGVHLRWQIQNAEQIEGFRIYRSDIATGIFELIGEAEDLQFLHSESEPGQWFKVFPYDAMGREARTARPVQAVEN